MPLPPAALTSKGAAAAASTSNEVSVSQRTSGIIRGLAKARWPGRCHTLPLSAAVTAPPSSSLVPPSPHSLGQPTGGPEPELSIAHNSSSSSSATEGRVRWHLDCAHTPVSAAECLQWFLAKTTVPQGGSGIDDDAFLQGIGPTSNSSSHHNSTTSTSSIINSTTTSSSSRRQPLRVLVFNCSHEKDVAALVDALVQDRSLASTDTAASTLGSGNSSNGSNSSNSGNSDASNRNNSSSSGVPAFDIAVFCPAGAARPSRHRQPTAKQLLKSYADGVGAGPSVVDSASSSNSNTDNDDDDEEEEEEEEDGSAHGHGEGKSGGSGAGSSSSAARTISTSRSSKHRAKKGPSSRNNAGWRLAYAAAAKTQVPEIIDPWALVEDNTEARASANEDATSAGSTTATPFLTKSNAFLGLKKQTTSAAGATEEEGDDEARAKDALGWQRTLAHVWLGLQPLSPPQPPAATAPGAAAAAAAAAAAVTTASLRRSEIGLPSVAVAPNLRAAFHWITTVVAAHVAAAAEKSYANSLESNASSSSSLGAAPSQQEREEAGAKRQEEQETGVDGDLSAEEDLKNVGVEVLVVGSVYLAGTALALLAPGSDGVNPG